MPLTPEKVEQLVAEHGSIRKAAKAIGKDDRTLRRILKKARGDDAPADSTTVEVRDDEVVLTMPGSDAPAPDAVQALVRENGLDPAEWTIVSVDLGKWNALGKADAETGANPVHELRRIRVVLRRRLEVALPTPAAHVPELVRPEPVRASVHEPDVIFVEGDHQAPYFDPRLDALATRATADVQPVEHVFLGDLLDLPTASRHADHPNAQATPQECVDAGYGVLRRRAEAAPNAQRKKVKGNHDWRLESYLLDHAAKFYGLAPAGEAEHALSLRRLLHLDALGVELIEDPRGWQHAEVELVPGPHGLIVRHGWITGANTAGRSLAKRGRSLLVGHTHGREHVFQWDPSAGVERQAAVVGTMSLVRDERFPHFAVCDEWLQGFAVVTRWRDGRFTIEHARYADGVLTWRDRRWEA